MNHLWRRSRRIACWTVCGILLAGASPRALWGQEVGEGLVAPGFGFVYGEGRTGTGAASRRFGFSTHRLADEDRIGSLALMGEGHTNGLPVVLLDAALAEENVRLNYRSVFMEMKRYFALGGNFHYYWGLRGGYSRVEAAVTPPGGTRETLRQDLVAPLALLALPLALEHPGFLLLAFMDGASLGLTFDLIPGQMWLDVQVGATLIPNLRTAAFAVEERVVLVRTLQLALVF